MILSTSISYNHVVVGVLVLSSVYWYLAMLFVLSSLL